MSVSWIPRIGSEFSGYRLEALIGHGGMSIVYKAQNLKLERTVALKLLAPELSDDESFRERFTRESRLAAALDHPNVIPIYEAGDEDGVFYIAMRYVPGSNLKALLQRDGPLDSTQTVSIIGQVASALNAAHELKGLVHRDVKPANILVVEGIGHDESHHVYLSDFGIAKQRSSNMLTKTGMFVGTADYASPEQIEGKELDRRADVYSLGCVLYECLTGAPAYEKDSEVALMYAHLLEPPPSVTQVRPDLPPEMDVVIAKAMAKSRDERYGTAKELAAALRNALAPGSTTTAPVERSSETILATVAPPASATTRATAATPPAAPPEATPDQSGGAPPLGAAGRADQAGARRKQLIAAAIIIAVLVAGGIAAAVLLSGGSKKKATTTTGGTVAAPTTLLSGLVPTGISTSCTTLNTPSKGAVETDSCTPPDNSPTSYPDEFSLSFYATGAALETAYEKAKSSVKIGNCGATPGEKTWLHVATGKRGGRRLCGSDKAGDAVIVWTHEKLGSPDHFDMLGSARAAGRGSNLFRSWWNAVNDDVGKCRPALAEDACFTLVKKFASKRAAA